MNGVVRILAIAFAIMFGTHAYAQGIREVTYTDRSIVSVQTKVRFTTLIVLPEGERILDFVCGDKDFWIVSGVDNLAYIKPAKAGASTNLNLISDSGRVYSFLLTEANGDPDLKVYVLVDDIAVKSSTGKHWYTAADVEVYRHQAEEARQEAAMVRAASEQAAAQSIATFRSTYPIQLRFTYQFRPQEKPFFVSAIYHDGQFTYIHSQSLELPSLYELRDGAPSLVPFQVERGVYVVPKVLERAYLAIGKRRFFFAQHGER